MRLTIARILIFLVLAWNLQAAIQLIAYPAASAPAYELSGEVGAALLRGLGILFLMWNVPYAVALWHPFRHRTSLLEAILMQAIGLAGETWVRLGLPLAHSLARLSLIRFIAFDALGLVFLVGAFILTRSQYSSSKNIESNQ